MTWRKSRFTDIRGHQVEFAAEFWKRDGRHWKRECESQKAQLLSGHKHGTNKNLKRRTQEKMS